MAAVRYVVQDVDRALEFYQNQLGFDVKARWGPPFAIVERDGLELWLSGPGTSAARPMPDGREPKPGGWNRIVVQVSDIEATVAALREFGTVMRNDVITGPGGSQILIEDPDGNPIELFQPRD